MITGFKILKGSEWNEKLIKYRDEGAQRGVYLGFPNLDRYYTMALPGVTDWTGFPTCFTREQLIITDRGNKQISHIKIGDKVLSYNHDKKVNEYKKVKDVLHHQAKEKIIKIKMKDGTIIKCTENHKFWNGNKYVKIKDLLK